MSMWDDEAGYDRTDPKHPSYRDNWTLKADVDRKRDREAYPAGRVTGGGVARVARVFVTLDESEAPTSLHDVARILLQCIDRPLAADEVLEVPGEVPR